MKDRQPQQQQQPLGFEQPKKWSLYQDPKLSTAQPPADASQRERDMHVALSKAKELINELRARIVRADSVAYIWSTVPTHPKEAECGRLMRQVLSADGDLSLQSARAEWQRSRE
jgi:hypothetical protein